MTIALKLLMAVSGLFFFGFVLAHMYGNLKAFAGHDATTSTPTTCASSASRCCRTRDALDPPDRAHRVAGRARGRRFALWRRASKARPIKYVMKKNNHSTKASHLMRWGGVTLLLFIVWHLLNFTIGKVNV